jgi:hypothetical protein
VNFDGLLYCAAADSALWKDKYVSGGVLAGSTLVWFLLDKSVSTFGTLLYNIMMFMVVILFVWSNVASPSQFLALDLHDDLHSFEYEFQGCDSNLLTTNCSALMW